MADGRASHKEQGADVVVFHADTQNMYDDDSLDPVYATKAKTLMIPSKKLEWGYTRCVQTLVAKSALMPWSSCISSSWPDLVGSRAYRLF